MKLADHFVKRLAVLVAALVLVCTAFWLPRQDKGRRLRVSPGLWPGSEAIVVAHARGMLPAAEFQFIELPWSSAAMRALGNGAADVAVVTLDAVLRMREAGQDLRVLMVLDESTGADAILARDDLTTIKALKGMRVGVDIRGVGAWILMSALEGGGLTMNDVRTVPLTHPEMEQAFADGLVDAVVASEPWAGRLRSSGMRAIFDSKQLPLPVMRVMVASEDACDHAGTRLAALLKAQIEMLPVVRSGGRFSGLDLILRREKTDAAAFHDALKLWSPVDHASNRALLSGDAPELAKIAEKLCDQMLRMGLLQARPPDQEWIDPTFLEEVLP